MAQRKYKTEWTEQQGNAPVAAARDGAMSVQSPARLLQQMLDERNAQLLEPQVDRWSQRRAVAFMAASASALWLAILAAGTQIAKFVA
ncbi:hypothetical protein Q4F19_18975 [Sphingomonas sp. BIUV-7]|uniref:Uncharacterized protein n=1 Tax=Sphingomonas natans TaxID=3063330 RepID=A0ABT8YFF2_9SPHN|nr:hypothetical protein [Sphingomonas sp. BIUV-7]MDO6416474.1 hypothetical protein [Sphingomonas sp. BIUV-7]